MRILMVADFHYQHKYGEWKLDTLQKTIAKCQPLDYIIFLGDFAHNSYLAKSRSDLGQALTNIHQVLDNNMVIFIEGNHDQYGATGSALDLLHSKKFIKVRDNVTTFSFNDVSICCVPWIRNRSDWHAHTVENLHFADKKHRLLLGHLNIVDTVTGFNHTVNKDDHFVFDQKTLSLHCNPTEMWFGHIHRRQNSYIGAFTQNNFGESGFKAGALLWEDGKRRFIDNDAPKFYKVEENFIDDGKSYYSFVSENPELYTNERYKVTQPKQEESNLIITQEPSCLDIVKIIKQYCEVKEIDYDLISEEVKLLCLDLNRSKTGLTRINYVKLNNVGPKGQVLIKNAELNFTDGICAVTGANGSGKTLAVESIFAAIHGSYVTRGSLASVLGKGSIEVSVFSHKEFVIKHKTGSKSTLESVVDGNYITKVVELTSLTEPVFGEASVCQSVMFADQAAKRDLVIAEESKRIEIMQSLLDLDILKEKYEYFSQKEKKLKESIASYESLKENFSLINDNVVTIERALEIDADLEDVDLNDLKRRYEVAVRQQELVKKHELWKSAFARYEEVKHLYDINAYNTETSKISRYEDLKREIKMLDVNDKIGCIDNPLPCVLLGNRVQRLAECKKEIEDIVIDYDVISDHKKASAAKNHAASLYDKTFDNLVMQEANPEVLRGRIDRVQEATKTRKMFKQSLAESTKKRDDILSKLETLGDIEVLRNNFYLASVMKDLCSKKGLPLSIVQTITSSLQSILDELCMIADIALRIRIQLTKKTEMDCFAIEYSRHERLWAPVTPCASKGEKNMIRFIFKLAMMLYLNSYFGNYKVVVFDEPEDGLEYPFIEAEIRLLRYLKGRLDQVIVVTHNEHIIDMADKVCPI